LHFAFCTGSSLRSQEPTYWQDVRPLLRKNCTVCHNPRQLKEPDISGGLVLDTYEAVLRWKEKNRPLVHAGKSATSLLYQVVSTDDSEKRMPLGAKPLPAESVALLKRWIDSGAKEGPRPDNAAVTPPPTRQVRARKLDVTLLSTTTPPGSAFPGLPRGPLALTLPVGPLSPVVAIAFHPTEPWLAAGAYGRVTVWDTQTGEPIQTLTSVLGAVNDLRFSPDGTLLAVAGGQPSAKGDLRLFTSREWKLKAVLAGQDDVVACVAFRPDGAKIASASYDRTLRIWNIATSKTERVLTAHSDFVTSVAWSPDGKLLASGSKDRSARLVEADTGAGKLTFSDRNEDVLAVAISPDGKTVVTAGMEPTLSWWNAETGERLRTVGGHRGAVHDLAFSRDGKLLASAGADGTVRLWNGTTGAFARSLAAGSLVYSVALSPDGKVAAAGSFDGLVRLFDSATGRHRVTLLSLPPAGDKTPWVATTPEGYVTGSDELLAAGRWTMAGRELPAATTRSVLRSPRTVSKALRGEAVGPPVFGK
jgi:DNA-binding beta-propeller fold protein YncE